MTQMQQEISRRAKLGARKEAPFNEELFTLGPAVVWRSFRAQHFGFICISLYLLFEYLKLEQSYPIFGVLPFLRLSVIGAIVGFLLSRDFKVPKSPVNVLLLLFLAHCVLSAYYAYSADYAFGHIEIITTWVILYFLIIAIVNSETRLFLFLLVYFLCNFKMAQFGFFSWVKRGFGFASWGVTGSGWFRNSGELGLEMSMFFAYTLCFALFLHKHWRGWVKWIMYFLPVSALGCVIASSSRGAILGAVGVLIYLSAFSKRPLRAWLATIVVLIAAYAVMPARFLERFQSAGNDATSLSRIAYWEKALDMLNQHPFMGVGYYNWIPYYTNYYFDPSLYWRVEQAHNTYLQMGAELGYTGLVIFIMLIVVTFFLNWRAERVCRENGFVFLRSFAMGMNAAGVGLIVASMFLTAFFMPNYWVHFAFSVCLSNVVRQRLIQKESWLRSGHQPEALG